jgi:hypothetical protein
MGQAPASGNRVTTLKKDLHQPEPERVREQEAKRVPGVVDCLVPLVTRKSARAPLQLRLRPLNGLIDTSGPPWDGREAPCKGKTCSSRALKVLDHAGVVLRTPYRIRNASHGGGQKEGQQYNIRGSGTNFL